PSSLLHLVLVLPFPLTPPSSTHPLPLHDALPIFARSHCWRRMAITPRFEYAAPEPASAARTRRNAASAASSFPSRSAACPSTNHFSRFERGASCDPAEADCSNVSFPPGCGHAETVAAAPHKTARTKAQALGKRGNILITR